MIDGHHVAGELCRLLQEALPQLPQQDVMALDLQLRPDAFPTIDCRVQVRDAPDGKVIGDALRKFMVIPMDEPEGDALDIRQDVRTKVVTINGQPYSFELFERLALLPADGEMLCVQRDPQTQALVCRHKPAAATFA